MKKLCYSLSLLLVAGFIFVSCSKDEGTTPQELKPTITFQTGSGYTFSDTTIVTGDSILVGVVCTPNSNSNAKLTNFKIYFIENNITIPTSVNITMNESSYTGSWKIPFDNIFDGKLYAEVTDKDGQKNSVSFNITVEASAGPINTYTAILLGGQNNATTGSFFVSLDGSVLMQDDATANQNKVDFLYFYGTTNQATIAAPNDDQALIAWANLFDSWTTKNATKFRKTSGVNWDNVTNDAIIVEEAVNLNDSRANTLAIDNIVAFETAATSANPGKKGLFKVIEITGTTGADRAIKIEVKIQE